MVTEPMELKFSVIISVGSPEFKKKEEEEEEKEDKVTTPFFEFFYFNLFHIFIFIVNFYF